MAGSMCLILFITSVLLLLSSRPVEAATVIATLNGQGHKWSNKTIWNTGRIPGTKDDVKIQLHSDSYNNVLIVDKATTVKSLIINATAPPQQGSRNARDAVSVSCTLYVDLKAPLKVTNAVVLISGAVMHLGGFSVTAGVFSIRGGSGVSGPGFITAPQILIRGGRVLPVGGVMFTGNVEINNAAEFHFAQRPTTMDHIKIQGSLTGYYFNLIYYYPKNYTTAKNQTALQVRDRTSISGYCIYSVKYDAQYPPPKVCELRGEPYIVSWYGVDTSDCVYNVGKVSKGLNMVFDPCMSQIGECRHNCSGHGTCDKSRVAGAVCQCDNGWGGRDCTMVYFNCPGWCGRGYCDTTTGQCVCNTGWTGDACQYNDGK